MRRLFSGKGAVLLAILLLFVFGQVMGMVAVRSFFIRDKMKDLVPQAQHLSSRISEGSFRFSDGKDFILKAYDAEGKELDLNDSGAPVKWTVSDAGIQEDLARYIPRILAGNTVADLRAVGVLPTRSIVVGVPLITQGKITGSVFLLRPASDFQAAVNGFSLVFFCTLVVGVLIIGGFLWRYVKEIQSLEETRRDYIANISHELKSPISSITALMETLADGMVQDEETRDRYYGIVLKESYRLERLISDMLEMSRLQSGNTVFQKAVVDAGQLMRTVYEKYSVLSDDMGIRFVMTEAAKSLPLVYTSEPRIMQILNILLDNAMKFVGDDGLIEIDSETTARTVTIKVKDNGIGIDKDAIPHVFDRFYKEDRAHTSGGSGLGLAIAQEIAQGLNEKLSVTSAVGVGTTFSFTMKRA